MIFMYLQENLMKTKNISVCAFQWKMIFNPDSSKQTEEVIFSRKVKNTTHPPLVFHNAIVSQINSQNHLEVTLDLKLTFEEHLLNVFKKINRTIGFLPKLQSLLQTSYYLQSLCQTPSGLWGYLIQPSFQQFFP